jgi:hypothetical protein
MNAAVCESQVILTILATASRPFFALPAASGIVITGFIHP